MAWTTDISKAPRGHYDIEARKVKGGKTADHRVFKPEYVWLATRCGKVTLSRYMPKEPPFRPVPRWEMLQPGEQPVAWHPFDPSDTYEEVDPKSGKSVTRYRKPDYPSHLREAA